MLPAIKASQKANPSSIEKLIWKELDKLGIKYETQVPLANGRFIVDIYILSRKLVIEINGDYYHDYEKFPEKEVRDEALEKYAVENGFKMRWLWESKIRKNSEQVLLDCLKSI